MILYRKDNETQLEKLFPKINFEENPSTILSIDLCFRFIPELIIQLELINMEDPLLKILKTQLHKWHYSGINSDLKETNLNFDTIYPNKCLFQLYLNRVVQYKKIKLSQLPILNKGLINNFGIYSNKF